MDTVSLIDVYRNNSSNRYRPYLPDELRKYEFNLALLSCIPGGQAEMILISRELQKRTMLSLFFT